MCRCHKIAIYIVCISLTRASRNLSPTGKGETLRVRELIIPHYAHITHSRSLSTGLECFSSSNDNSSSGAGAVVARDTTETWKQRGEKKRRYFVKFLRR